MASGLTPKIVITFIFDMSVSLSHDHIMIYFVPYKRSPASPSPGIIYP